MPLLEMVPHPFVKDAQCSVYMTIYLMGPELLDL